MKQLGLASKEVLQLGETEMVSIKKEYMLAMTETLQKINPGLIALYVDHSRGGGITAGAITGMDTQEVSDLNSRIVYRSFAPSHPVDINQIKDAVSYCSKKDRATGWFCRGFKAYAETEGFFSRQPPRYDIKMIECISPESQWAGRFGDHRILGDTLQSAIRKDLAELYITYGFLENRR